MPLTITIHTTRRQKRGACQWRNRSTPKPKEPLPEKTTCWGEQNSVLAPFYEDEKPSTPERFRNNGEIPRQRKPNNSRSLWKYWKKRRPVLCLILFHGNLIKTTRNATPLTRVHSWSTRERNRPKPLRRNGFKFNLLNLRENFNPWQAKPQLKKAFPDQTQEMALRHADFFLWDPIAPTSCQYKETLYATTYELDPCTLWWQRNSRPWRKSAA